MEQYTTHWNCVLDMVNANMVVYQRALSISIGRHIIIVDLIVLVRIDSSFMTMHTYPTWL